MDLQSQGSIKNKKLLSDLIEKEKGYRNAENISENKSNNEKSSSDVENQEEEEVASENGSEVEGTQESDDTENDSQETTRLKQLVVSLRQIGGNAFVTVKQHFRKRVLNSTLRMSVWFCLYIPFFSAK